MHLKEMRYLYLLIYHRKCIKKLLLINLLQL